MLLWWLILLAFIFSTADTRRCGFFVQQRVGMNGRLFRVIKIRTMRDVKAISTSVTRENDPRITPLGRFWRKTKIDELPQLINVILGQMSLVGPRPTVKEDYQRMDQRQRKRVTVKPGLTGLAQISGNTALSWPERIEYDLKYINEWSIELDLKIIMKTFQLILSGKAETHPSSGDEWEGNSHLS